MPYVAAAVAGAGLIGSVISSNAASDASDAQVGATNRGIDVQNQQFQQIQQLLSPYVQAGTGALGQQQTLLGLNGAAGQQSAIDALKSSPYFQSQLAAGENSITQNAAATGGLRGGNTQAALAQFSPALLAQTIQQQYQNLGGLSSLGQNAAAGVGNAGQANASAVSNLLQQQGAAQAGNSLAQGSAYNNALGGIVSGIGIYGSQGGFGTAGNGNGAYPAGTTPYSGGGGFTLNGP